MAILVVIDRIELLIGCCAGMTPGEEWEFLVSRYFAPNEVPEAGLIAKKYGYADFRVSSDSTRSTVSVKRFS